MRPLVSVLLAGTLMVGSANVLCAQEARPHIGTFGFDEKAMDRSIKPGGDFFAYANGTWFKNTPIPADKPAIGSYIEMEDLTNQRIREVLEAAKTDPSSKIGRAYASYLDTARVEELGLTPIRPWLGKIKALSDRKGYSALVADADAMRIGGPLVYWVWQDDKEPTQARLMIDQGGVGLLDRNMYLADTPGYPEIRTAYVTHLARLLTLAGEANGDARAQAVMALETEIARVHWPREDAEDMTKTYHRFALAETAGFSTPTLNLTAILKIHGPKLTHVVIREPSAVKGIAAIVDEAPLEVLKDQMILRSLDGLAEALPAAIDDESFAFYGTLLAGTMEQEPRWRRAVKFVSDALRDEVGRQYAARYFPPSYKAEMNEMVDNMLAAMGERIDQLEWMQPQTKARAKEKLKGMSVRAGYPDQWRNYDGLQMKADDRFGNRLRASRFDFRYTMDRASEPTRRWEWFFGAQTVNANANYNLLQLTFPAAFLQPPVFDPAADPAINYGAIGAVAAHEISHNFDNTGAKYNESGVLADWWPPQDVKAFEAAGNALVAHSPDIQRVWTVRNIDAWYEAFDVKPGDKLYLPPEKRVKVW